MDPSYTRDQSVPLLEDVLALMTRMKNKTLVLDIKDDNSISILKFMGETIGKMEPAKIPSLLSQVYIGVWNLDFFREVRANPVLAQFQICYISASLDSIVWDADILSIKYLQITQDFVAKVHAVGKVLFSFSNWYIESIRVDSKRT